MTARMETTEYADERQNVTALFSSVGIETPQQITIQQSPGETYDLEPRPEDNWVYAALLGLKELNRRLEAEGRACRHFITVGTGPGLDAPRARSGSRRRSGRGPRFPAPCRGESPAPGRADG